MDISKNALMCTKNKVELLFPHLITSICRQAKVPMGRSRHALQPSKFSILESNVDIL
ncbi:hypothetical protein PVK06_030180 [Gossypium arboreum]|uniref:Uncharacterized protein n=1 Tax=Gossypium arboreum TaxID=29729 RepID=A0ABR0NMS7_GOSAR|nr:hypothetical protein PVK06_030180 [Gossypium arboreum]